MPSPDGPPNVSRFQLPGFVLPLNWAPRERPINYDIASDGVNNKTFQTIYLEYGEGIHLFRTALNDIDCLDGLVSLPMTTLREFTMLHIMNSLTDKPGWEIKVFNEVISQKWKTEALETPGRDVSQKMVDWVIEELRCKAKIFQQTSAVSLYNGDVVKSDAAIPENLRQSLKDGVRILEDIPVVHKDYHPGSKEKVLNLVHPSLFPLIYGKSRILENSLIGLDDCIQSCGKGIVLPIRPDEECLLDRKGWAIFSDRHPDGDIASYSNNSQWLPSEIEFTEGGNVKLTSYINNLHPKKHQDLYSIVEQVIDRAIPLWNMTLTPLKAPYRRVNRIVYKRAVYDPNPENIPEEDGPQQEDGEDDYEYNVRREEWIESVARLVQPEPGEFRQPTVENYSGSEYFDANTSDLKAEKRVDLKRDYAHRGLQVIVKLANIELNTEKPHYDGGTWHVEGQMNEHICATALYYYDNENISESHLSFRQQSSDDSMEISYEQDRHEWLSGVFGLQQDGPRVQEVGSVLCKEGRLLTFPNILQHQVQPFKLANPSKPGHRKILALFLVDPGIRIISTANVPPQRRDWWSEKLIDDLANTGKALAKLSPELKDKIFECVEDFPISMEEAKEIRLRVIEERTNHVVYQARAFEAGVFSLCEH